MILVGQNFRTEPLTEFCGLNWSAKLPQFPAIGGQCQGGCLVRAQRCLSDFVMLYMVLEK